jgi:hypothetical protein
MYCLREAIGVTISGEWVFYVLIFEVERRATKVNIHRSIGPKMFAVVHFVFSGRLYQTEPKACRSDYEASIPSRSFSIPVLANTPILLDDLMSASPSPSLKVRRYFRVLTIALSGPKAEIISFGWKPFACGMPGLALPYWL